MMCGICGIYDTGRPVDHDLLTKMTSIMSHRGPDGTGWFNGDEIGLGHRRLSIIDIEGGSQPIANENGRIHVVFNGEIYNFIELKKALEERGHIFQTRSDTEVIVHGYEEWGKECVNYFNGMFSFALWDSDRKELMLARDHLGIKPLYYFTAGGRLVFASEIKALLQDESCPRGVDIQSLGDLFTFRYVPSPRTLFKQIWKLPPGHMLICNAKGIGVRQFWNWKPRIDPHIKQSEAIECYQELMEDAIRLQLRSDVPVGLFLSSGIDSNAILAIMAKHIPGAINTFTIGFEDGDLTNETDDARIMAKKFGANHTEMIIGPKDYEKYYENYMWNIEEPVGNESAAAFYFVSLIASRKVKVALTGQGADEPWAGYHRHLGVKLSCLYSKLPALLTAGFKKLAFSLPRSERLKRGVLSLDEPDLMTRFTKIYSFFSEEMKKHLFQEWVKQEMSGSGYDALDALRHLQKNVGDMDALTQILYIDTRANLPDDLLMVNDKTSMANSIEARVPFLDYRLVEFIETLPSNWKLKGFEGKYLHKKAVEKWLPREMIYRKKKGFANPINEWLRGRMNGYVEECLLSADSAVSNYFNRDYIKTLVQLHNNKQEEYFRQIYLLISFELWHRRFISQRI